MMGKSPAIFRIKLTIAVTLLATSFVRHWWRT